MLGVPSAGHCHVASIAQVNQAPSQAVQRGNVWGAWGQGLELEAGVHTARGCWETSHLSFKLPPHSHHIAPPKGHTHTHTAVI